MIVYLSKKKSVKFPSGVMWSHMFIICDKILGYVICKASSKLTTVIIKKYKSVLTKKDVKRSANFKIQELVFFK